MTDLRKSRYTNTIISTSRQRTWLPLFIGLAVGLVGMHLTVSRPMRKQWKEELLTVRRDLSRMDTSVGKVAAVGRQAGETNTLLTAMNDQQSLLQESQKTLKLVAQLTEKIESQQESLSHSYAALENLTGLRDRILERAGEGSEAMPTLDRLLELRSQLVARSRDLDVAEEIASRYVNMKDSLMTSAEDLPIAEQNLNRWIGLQDRIVEESATTKTAEGKLSDMLALQNRLAKNVSGNRASNVEAASRTNDSMTQKFLDIASIHPVVGNAIRALEPFAELLDSSKANQTATEAQASQQTSDQSPLVAPRPRKKNQGFVSEWETQPITNE